MERKEQFLKELKDLLAKYDVEIDYTIDGDTHGVEVNLTIDMKIPATPGKTYDKWETIKIADSISAYNL